MAVQFTPDGARFPESLVEEFIQGSVTLVCGAGVSAPQLPGFFDLVEQIRAGCGLEWEGGERLSLDAGRYEETLGALQRRLIRPERIYELAARELAVPADPDFSHHDILLRLSRDRENRIALVTTNFDTMFERALARQESPARAVAISHAGQDLPAPGASSFNGLIHMHGRLADPELGLTASRLVLTSSEYGDAYMRSGWAARFLFDLARTSTLVLIGYSASDAPVRYFLNVLEADRLRFSDLKPVYAMDGAELGHEAAAQDRWAPLAVRVITYPVRSDGDRRDYGALWRDLSQLADLVENNLAMRRQRIASILTTPPSEIVAHETDALRWAVQAGVQVESAILESITDPQWWKSLNNDRVVEPHRLAYLAAAWVARRWEEPNVFNAFLTNGPQLGAAFARSIEWELNRSQFEVQPWERAWRLLARSIIAGERSRDDATSDVAERLRRGLALDADLRRLIRANTPRVRLSRPLHLRDTPRDTNLAGHRLSDLAYISLELPDGADAHQLARLHQESRRLRVATLTTNALLEALEDGQEAGLIGMGWDLSDLQVPAIGGHEQNSLVHGLLPLSSLLSSLTPALVAEDATSGRELFGAWRRSGRRLLTRHWLFALLTSAYSANETGQALLDLPAELFWTIKRDLVRVLAEKLHACSPAIRSALEVRILDEGPLQYADLELGADDDWRPGARDQDIWLRLAMLRRSGPLGERADRVLDEIRARRSYLGEEPAERDLFSSYMTTSSGPIGDPTSIIEADVADRVEVAERLIQTGDFEQAHGWSRFVETSPQAALDSLLVSDLELRRAPLWGELLGRIRYGDRQDPAQLAASRDWLEQSFEHLEAASDPFLDAIGYPLASALEGARELEARVRENWWDRLWASAERVAIGAHERRDALVSAVLNTSAGRLGLVLTSQVEAEQHAGESLSPDIARRLEQVMTSPGAAGPPGRAALVQNIGLVFLHGSELCGQYLHPLLSSATPEGAELRAIMLEWGRLGPHASRAFRNAVSLGVRESEATSPSTVNIVAKLLYPLFLARLRPNSPDYGVHEVDVAADLAAAPEELRVAALSYIARWLGELTTRDHGVEWREVIGPVLDGMWPQDRRLRSSKYTPQLLSIVAAAGDAFPEAAEWARPWLQSFERDWFSLHAIRNNLERLRHFPEELFNVLWAVAGPPFEGHSDDLAPILDVLVQEIPALARDRRMQWLEARTIRRAA